MTNNTASFDIVELGNPILREHAEKVVDFGSPALLEVVEQMTLLMKERNGVGIAAPQIAISLQVIIVASRPNQRYPGAPHMVPTVMVNPKIIDQSIETDMGWEGCLSVPGIRGNVERSIRVKVSFYDIAGVCQEQTLEGFPARIFLHEYDHLIGLTFLDRVASTLDLASEKECR